MIIPPFIRAFLVGFIAALPAGPISVLCIKKSLTERLRSGIATALGAATGDAFFALFAALGIPGIGDFLLAHLVSLRLIAAMVLAGLGIKSIWFARSSSLTNHSTRNTLESYLSALFLTLTNPITFLTFAAAFTAVGLGNSAKNAPDIAIGVLAGSFTWFAALALIASAMKSQCSLSALARIQHIAGAILIACAAGVLLSIAAI